MNSSESKGFNVRRLMAHSFVGLSILVGGIFAMNLFGLALQSQIGMQATLIASEVVVILGAAFGYRALYSKAISWPTFETTGLSLKSLFLITITTLVLAAVANLSMEIILHFIPSLEGSAQQYVEQLKKLLIDARGIDRIMGIVAVCLAAPICEEALFRGTILEEQLRRQPVAIAVIGNGFLFSAFHLNPTASVALAAVGAFFSHLLVASRNLLLPILGHAILNTANGLALPALVDVEKSGTLIEELGFAQFGVVFCLLLFVAIFLWQNTIEVLYKARRKSRD